MTFTGGTVNCATLIVVPVVDGVAAKPTSKTAVIFLQKPTKDGVAEFNFQLKPTTGNGVYALYTGGVGTGFATGYFEINDAVAPTVVKDQIFQYDDYKDSIDLKFSEDSNGNFKSWAEDKSKMNIILSIGGRGVSIHPDMLKFDTEEKTMSISAYGYADIIPAFGSVIEGNILEAEISITTPGYWVEDEYSGTTTGTFKLVAPEFSAEGFKNGVDFEIQLYSDNALSEANAIIALYDDKALVDAVYEENISIAEGTTETIKVTMKNDKLKESGKFSVKVMLWKGFTTEPITSFVLFP